MGDGKKTFEVSLAILLVLVFLNSLFHISVYGTGIHAVFQTGSSQVQMFVGNLGFVSNILLNTGTRQISFIAICTELLLIASLLVIASLKMRAVATKSAELGGSTALLQPTHAMSKTETELDVLYRMLQNRKSMKLSAAIKIFKVDQDTIIQWCKILENANLATMSYPRVGEPEIDLVE